MFQNVHYPVATLAVGDVKSPGLCSIKYFKKEDVLTWPTLDPETGMLATAITLKPGKFIYICQAINPSKAFDESQKAAAAGPYFDMSVKGSLSGSTAAHFLTLGTMIHHQWGLIVPDKNGVTRLIGNQDSGADLAVDYSSGQGADSRKTELSWKWQHPQPAPIYTANAFDIVIGGVTVTAGSLQMILRFEVGAVGAPMTEGDILLINAGFANKNLLIICDGLALPIDDLTGMIDWSGSIQRHVEKGFASNTIEFIGGVINHEIIEIYAFS
jgi:hypothetical protein